MKEPEMKEPQSQPAAMIRDRRLQSRLSSGSLSSAMPAAPAAGEDSASKTARSTARLIEASRLRREQAMAGEQLLGMGRNLRILAVAVIVVLSAGMALLLYSQFRENAAVVNAIGDPDGLLGGFGFLMLLTVIYLVSKHWTTSRNQRRMIDQRLEEEAVARALRQNPITDFHHPEVCRDILMQQASHAARLRAPLSLIELKIAGLEKMSQNADTQRKVTELIRQIKGLCRASDAVLRWAPDSLLLAFPEVTQLGLAALSQRLGQDLNQWIEQHYEEGSRPALELRGASSTSLDSCGDILVETQRLLERESRIGTHRPETGTPASKHEKGIALKLELKVTGEDQHKKCFEQRIVTERVAADRFWCPLEQALMELSPLTVSATDGSFCEQAVLVRWVYREDERLAEIQFNNTPDRWVIRGDT